MTWVEDTGSGFKPALQFNVRKELEHSFGITRVKKPEKIARTRSHGEWRGSVTRPLIPRGAGGLYRHPQTRLVDSEQSVATGSR
jgi:hypothetical protein